ncbi:hypothetical protein B0H14DRAFT_3534709 [Mycena olivaceomarginata]|nr:hypothetical protein B0H14DRAFT_3534709 [Mycena olivaceomarginata]
MDTGSPFFPPVLSPCYIFALTSPRLSYVPWYLPTVLEKPPLSQAQYTHGALEESAPPYDCASARLSPVPITNSTGGFARASGHVCPTLLPSFHYFVFSIPPRLARFFTSYLPLPFSISTLTCSCPPLRIDERDLRRVLHPALTSSRIPLRAHDPSRPSVRPPLLFRIRRYTRSRYADLRLIHAAAARHAPAPYPAFQYCPPSLPPSVLAVLLLRHFTYSIFFPISDLIRSGCPPSPSRCRPLLVLRCADPLTLPRHLSNCSSCLGVPVPTYVRPHFGRPHRLARGRALHDLREVSHRTCMISSPSLLTHSSDPFPPRPFPRLSFCARLLVSLSPCLLARSPHVRLGAFILILHDTSRLRLPSTSAVLTQQFNLFFASSCCLEASDLSAH